MSIRIDLPGVIERTEAFWHRTNQEAVCYLIFPDGFEDFSPVAKDWMAPAITRGWSNWQQELVVGQALELIAAGGSWQRLEEALDLLEFLAERTGHAGEGFPFLLPGFGPGCVAACLSDHFTFKDSTIWLEPPEPWDRGRLQAITPQSRAPFHGLAVTVLKRLVARMQPHAVISMPDLGWPMDTLSALHGNAELCMDLIDEPEEVTAVGAVLEEIIWDCHATFDAIIRPGNHGCHTERMRWLSAEPMRMEGCDFSALIGPDMFADFVLPEVERSCARTGGRVIFHLDGPGELPHVEHLLGTDLHAIQWVQGAGNPGPTDPCWDELYRRLIDADKRICIGAGDPDALAALFTRFPQRYFHVNASCRDRAHAEAILRVRDRTGSSAVV
ncbi:MAG: hypothetical protein ACOCXJ_02735 [Planctomycetota bacterium]